MEPLCAPAQRTDERLRPAGHELYKRGTVAPPFNLSQASSPHRTTYRAEKVLVLVGQQGGQGRSPHFVAPAGCAAALMLRSPSADASRLG